MTEVELQDKFSYLISQATFHPLWTKLRDAYLIPDPRSWLSGPAEPKTCPWNARLFQGTLRESSLGKEGLANTSILRKTKRPTTQGWELMIADKSGTILLLSVFTKWG